MKGISFFTCFGQVPTRNQPGYLEKNTIHAVWRRTTIFLHNPEQRPLTMTYLVILKVFQPSLVLTRVKSPLRGDFIIQDDN